MRNAEGELLVGLGGGVPPKLPPQGLCLCCSLCLRCLSPSMMAPPLTIQASKTIRTSSVGRPV